MDCVPTGRRSTVNGELVYSSTLLSETTLIEYFDVLKLQGLPSQMERNKASKSEQLLPYLQTIHIRRYLHLVYQGLTEITYLQGQFGT